MSFEEARACVLSKIPAAHPNTGTETIPIIEAHGRVLAETVAAERNYPPFPRSARDGFAVRAEDVPGQLGIIGEVRAGAVFQGEVGSGQAVEIMTGAPVPKGADAVVMIEHTLVSDQHVKVDRALNKGENIVPAGSEVQEGQELLKVGSRLDFAAIGALAMVGKSQVTVYRLPQIAILPTGDEIIELEQRPLAHQIRNTNSYSLAAQVQRAGAAPVLLPIARDEYEETRRLIEQALQLDMVLLSGGVSAGKYDIVERVLGDLGAEFYFDRVLIQPGQPVVFGRVTGKFFFGLPGNPASTMLIFEVFARAAVERLSGQTKSCLPILQARLTCEFRQKQGLTRFLPAQLSCSGPDVTPLQWAGSGDIPALARANCFLVTDPRRETWAAGEAIRVLLK